MLSSLKDYLNYLAVERGLAKNTLESYERDLRQYLNYLKEKKGLTLNATTQTTVVGYLLQLQAQGKATATLSRSLAAIKSYHHFMAREGKIDRDPTVNLDAPRQEKRLPRVLSVHRCRTPFRTTRPKEPSRDARPGYAGTTLCHRLAGL